MHTIGLVFQDESRTQLGSHNTVFFQTSGGYECVYYLFSIAI